MLMDVIPLDASLVKGSHGRRPSNQQDWPVFITGRRELLQTPQIESTDVFTRCCGTCCTEHGTLSSQ
jgi:hypothetical protein